jgi:hypothetical protein
VPDEKRQPIDDAKPQRPSCVPWVPILLAAVAISGTLVLAMRLAHRHREVALMRGLARHLFTLCSAVSLLLCIATCALWVRSYWVGHSVMTRRTQIEHATRVVVGSNGIGIVGGFVVFEHDMIEQEWGDADAAAASLEYVSRKDHGMQFHRFRIKRPFSLDRAGGASFGFGRYAVR